MSLETKALSVGYGKKVLLKDVSLKINPGEILTLIGPNGSGKSTILKTITRQLETLEGYIFLDGKDQGKMKSHEIAKAISMVMTEKITPEMMSCKDVVATGRYPYTGKFGILQKEDEKKVMEALTLVHACEVATKDFLKISDGQKQRVMLARALCQDTRILVLDEPTSYLDLTHKVDILNRIRNLAREKNMAVIMSLHELDLACKVSDRIACVDGEKIVQVGTPKDIFQGGQIHKLYGIEEDGFDAFTGNLLLPKVEGEPQVFVIGGGGSGIPVYNQLWREHIPFVAGVLSKNDAEYQIAKGMAMNVVATEAFYPVTEKEFLEAKKMIESCDRVIVTVTEFGPMNEKNKELISYGEALGKSVENVFVSRGNDTWQK